MNELIIGELDASDIQKLYLQSNNYDARWNMNRK